MLPDRRQTSRKRWWTRERVLSGLCQLQQDTGQSPTWRRAYRALVASVDAGKQEALRRYPSEYAVALYWASLAEAWRAAGIEVYGQRELLTPPTAGMYFGRSRPRGERHGRLIILEFSGYTRKKSGRITLWRCRCDCGEERIVQADRLYLQQECRRCAAASLRAGRLKGLARCWAARRAAAAAGVQTSVLPPLTQERA